MILDLRTVKRTDYNLSWQHADTIARFNKVIDKKYDVGSAEMLYKLSKISYKKQFWDFCNRNHYQIVVDQIEYEKEWLSNMPESAFEEPLNYGDATMRHSTQE
tara:strand:- start:185 stop:493 length:309 start_codon:yes stop_codon:yes gene_type:complete